MNLTLNIPELGKLLNAVQENSRVMSELVSALENVGAVPAAEEAPKEKPKRKPAARKTKPEPEPEENGEDETAEKRQELLGRMRKVVEAGAERETVITLIRKFSDTDMFKDVPDEALSKYEKGLKKIEDSLQEEEEEEDDDDNDDFK